MSDTAIATIDPQNEPTKYQAPSDISKPELVALAQYILSPQEYTLWLLLHDSVETRGNASLHNLVQRAGFIDFGQNASRIVSETFGKVEAVGVSRARSIEIMCGFTKETVVIQLAKLMQESEEKTKVKALDISSKILGLQSSGHPLNVTVNVQVNQAVSSLVKDAIDDED